MKKYLVYSISTNITYKLGRENRKGKELLEWALPHYGEPDPNSVREFDDEEEARSYFNSCEASTKVKFGKLYLKAYFFEGNEYEADEDGDLDILETVDYEEKFEDLISWPFAIQERETGNTVEYFSSQDEAENELAIYEREDEEDGTYTEDFYQIVYFDSDLWEWVSID